jgi:hypothetical protein
VIPGFAERFDIEHVLAAIAPRRFMAVSGNDDKYAADADELVALARSAFSAAGADARELPVVLTIGSDDESNEHFAS